VTIPKLLFDPALARQVKIDALVPYQHLTGPRFKIAYDFRQQVMRKHPHLCEFHSRAEHLHAGLLEGDPHVTSYIPQLFQLRIGKRVYTPDCYVASDNAPHRVLELKPRAEMDEALQIPLTAFFAQHGMRFEVISNESVFEREIEAQNWLEIVRILYLAREFEDPQAESDVLAILHEKGPCTLGDIIDPGDRERTFFQEMALYRLLHRGH